MPPRYKQRKRVFIGCEGESERSYAALLQQFMGSHAEFHLVPALLNGGDPLANVESAVKALRHEESKKRGALHDRFVLLDADLLGRAPERDQRCAPLAAQYGLRLIWQTPCHEALVLRHLDDCQQRRPQSSELSEQQLAREWPEYSKNSGKDKLSQRITVDSLGRVAPHEPELAILLRLLGLV